MKNDQKALEALWKNYHHSRGEDSRDELIVQYLFLVKYVVGKLGSSLPSHIKLDDLYSSGVTGLIRAVEKFDFSKNAKFESYALLLIRGSIIDELRKLDWIPRSVHQKANWIATAQEALQQQLGREPTDVELSSRLGMEEEELQELLERIRPAILVPLDGEAYLNEEESVSLAEKIADTRAETSFQAADRSECARIIEQAIKELPAPMRAVLVYYYYEELMLKEIGKIMGVTESRVSQIHTKALIQLRMHLKRFMREYQS